MERVEVRAWVEGDASEQIQRARDEAAQGNVDWQRWLDELHAGQAILAALAVSVTVRHDDGRREPVQAENHSVWVELGSHVPVLEAQIAELAGKDFDWLAAQLREHSDDVTADALGEMYCHVDLADELRERLRHARQTARRGRRAAARVGFDASPED